MRRLWNWWLNYRVYRRRAIALAWDDVVQGIKTSEFNSSQLDQMLELPLTFPSGPFGRFKQVNEELNRAR
jgi:hypothetical protein